MFAITSPNGWTFSVTDPFGTDCFSSGRFLGQHHLHIRVNRKTQGRHAFASKHRFQYPCDLSVTGTLDPDIQMVVLPFFYVMGKSLLNSHFAVGGTLVINNTFVYPATVLNQMVEEKVTGFSGVPSTYAFLLHRSPLAGLPG